MATEQGVSPALRVLRGLHLESPLSIFRANALKRDLVIKSFHAGYCAANGRTDILDPSQTTWTGTAVLWGFEPGHKEKMFRCYEEGRPFLHFDHAYFKRGYRTYPDAGRFRINFCHWHQTRIFSDLEPIRAGGWRRRMLPWKKDGKTVVVIVPSPSICNAIGTLCGEHEHPKEWASDIAERLKRITQRPVVVKEKGEGLAGFLANAWAVVSISSVAEVEAAIAGVPVFVSQDSPAWQVGLTLDDLERIDDPIYPDREMWLRTLAYSQFDTDEMRSGYAWETLKALYGNHNLRGTSDGDPELDAQERPRNGHP